MACIGLVALPTYVNVSVPAEVYLHIQAPSPPTAVGALPFNADPSLRGPEETSNTRARLWISRQGQGRPAVHTAQPTALVSHAAMSGIGSYKATFATLAAIAFLGALGQVILGVLLFWRMLRLKLTSIMK